ncbi:MAG: small basic protein [Phycisphaerales bacterium]|nr:small basic protein [Planctomycetota bacterium]MCH8507450.1 small basic protein [Phycisphaerales bacterium]
MSIDRSLKTEGNLTTKRSVMKRGERIAALKDEKRLDPKKDGALGLPKTKVRE